MASLTPEDWTALEIYPDHAPTPSARCFSEVRAKVLRGRSDPRLRRVLPCLDAANKEIARALRYHPECRRPEPSTARIGHLWEATLAMCLDIPDEEGFLASAPATWSARGGRSVHEYYRTTTRQARRERPLSEQGGSDSARDAASDLLNAIELDRKLKSLGVPPETIGRIADVFDRDAAFPMDVPRFDIEAYELAAAAVCLADPQAWDDMSYLTPDRRKRRLKTHPVFIAVVSAIGGAAVVRRLLDT